MREHECQRARERECERARERETGGAKERERERVRKRVLYISRKYSIIQGVRKIDARKIVSLKKVK